MQQKLVLYIGNDLPDSRVDQFKDENVSFTQTIQNVKDLKKIFTEFTKTFALPASKKNNAIFKHYYNYDIADGFDARTKVDAFLELNDIPFKTGKIALTGVDLKNNVPHTYKVTFYGNTVNLKDVLGDDQLSSLTELNIVNTTYDYATVLAAMQNEYLGNLIVPLITHTQRATYNTTLDAYGNLYYKPIAPPFTNTGIDFTEFKYAIRLYGIVSAIEQQYPSITFSTDFFNTSNTDFYNLYMWLHRKSGGVTGETQVERIYNTVDNFQQTSQTNDINSLIPQSPSNSLLIWLDYPAITPEPMTRFITISLRLTPTAGTSNVDYSVRVFSNSNIEVGGFVDQQGQQYVTGLTDTLQNRTAYTVQISSSSTIEFSTGDIEWIITSQKTIFNNPPLPTIFETSTSKYSNSSLFTVGQTLEFNITEQIPKMKIIDFLTGIFQMFNLTAYVENDIIVVQTLDEFYDKAPKTTNPLIIPPQVIPVNIDKYLDTTKSSVDIALPFSKVNFTYKGVGTFLAKQFNQLYNRVWGSNSYSIENDIYDTPSSEYKIEIPFEHMMYERLYNAATGGQTQIQYGYFVNENQQSYIGEPLIFYAYKQVNQTNIVIRNASTQTVINDYYIPMNSKHINPSTSKVNIHFNNFVNEYQANQTGVDALAFTDTLFQTQYSNYINEVFNPSRRLTKVTAYLPYKIFSSLQLYDRIEIGQKYYKINSMTTDLTTGKTDFELLNCDL